MTQIRKEQTALEPTGNNCTQLKILRQDNTTDGYDTDTVILSGWGAISGSAAHYITEAVTFGIEFDAIPIVTCSYIGRNDTADSYPPDETGLDIASGQALTPSTTGFTACVHNFEGTNLDAGKKYYYHWIAIGQKA